MLPKISVIISTYNKPDWLEKVLWGYAYQTFREFEILIADDGSGKPTQELIESFKKDYPVPLTHVWHEAPQYERQKILNIAIKKSNSSYILFTDGDCIPREDFVEVHYKNAEMGRFLSGGYCKIPMKTSKKITHEDVKNQNCFRTSWLDKIEFLSFRNRLKLIAKNKFAHLLNDVTLTKPTFNNCNSSAYKEDLLTINGYDERMKYGGPDRELGERLENHGVMGKQIRYSAICLHLDHPRGYATKESWKKNYAIRKNTKTQKVTWTPYGIEKELD